MPRCSLCGQDVDMPYTCSYCGSVHCEEHRLPEAHACSGADKAAAARIERQRTGHPGVEIKGGWTGTTRGRSSGSGGSLGSHEGRISMYLLGAIVATFVAQLVVHGIDPALVTTLFVLDAGWFTKPWTLVTSVFAHGGLYHLMINGLILFFFGPVLERRIGSRRFLYLVAAGGILAGLIQVTVYSTFLGDSSGVLGFSGALMAILGALTVLGPRLSVLLFFIIPMPLWALTIGYAALDIYLGVFGGDTNVAHLAHLTGLTVGFLVGYKLRQAGLAFPGRQGHIQGGYQPGRSRW